MSSRIFIEKGFIYSKSVFILKFISNVAISLNIEEKHNFYDLDGTWEIKERVTNQVLKLSFSPKDLSFYERLVFKQLNGYSVTISTAKCS